ncbi:MAG: hypothetical protein PHX08_02020 [Lachnospiraceae bacterium]|nr:hypothetical protein [Lachnospiraceae bacterium]
MRHIKLTLILVFILILTSCSLDQTVQQTERNVNEYDNKGVFTVTFVSEDNYAIFSDGERLDVRNEYMPVFINGKLSKCISAFEEGGSLYVPSDFGENYLDTTLELSDETMMIKDGAKYLNLSDSLDNTSWNMNFVEKGSDNMKEKTLLLNHSSIYLFNNTSTAQLSVGEGLEVAKETSEDVLVLFESSIKEDLKKSDEDITRFDEEISQIRHDISEITYLGETPGYYIYDMNYYRIIIDKYTGQPYYNYESGLATDNVVLDPENSKIFMPLYIIG